MPDQCIAGHHYEWFPHHLTIQGWHVVKDIPETDASIPKPVSVPACDLCGRVQTSLGGIEYGPPRTIGGINGQWCQKLHVCVACSRAHTKDR